MAASGRSVPRRAISAATVASIVEVDTYLIYGQVDPATDPRMALTAPRLHWAFMMPFHTLQLPVHPRPPPPGECRRLQVVRLEGNIYSLNNRRLLLGLFVVW